MDKKNYEEELLKISFQYQNQLKNKDELIKQLINKHNISQKSILMIAKRMLDDNIPKKIIQKYTQLSFEIIDDIYENKIDF